MFFSFASIGNAQLDSKYRKSDGIIVATWNIGHFSKGQKDHSTISASDYKKVQGEFKSFIYDSLKADVLCINEYEERFCSDSLKDVVLETDKVLFDGYRTRQMFKKNSFVCNALFSKRKMKHTLMRPFIYNLFAEEDRKNISWHYYVMADINLQGKKVKLVCTHLVPLAERHCQNQIKEILNACEKYDRVIICGDMNTWDFSRFKKAGYRSATDGKVVTFPSKSYSLDNIFVKGLKISNVRVCKTNLSDHYAVKCMVSL